MEPDRHEHDAPALPALASAPEGGGDLLEATFNTSLQKFLAAMGGKAKVTSGKRSNKRQQELWEQALKKYGDPEVADNWVARPGTSRHESGLAADLSFHDDKTRAEAHRVAQQYGLHFPMEWEPWHIEPLTTKSRRG